MKTPIKEKTSHKSENNKASYPNKEQLYNLLFNGSITMREYLQTIERLK
jgi:hypothetical protein